MNLNLKNLLSSQLNLNDESLQKMQLFINVRWFLASLIFLYAIISFLASTILVNFYFYWILLVLSAVVFNVATSLKLENLKEQKKKISEESLFIQTMFDFLLLGVAIYLVYFNQNHGIAKEVIKVELLFFPLVLALFLLNTRYSLFSFFLFLVYQLFFSSLSGAFFSDQFFSMFLTSSILCGSLLFVKNQLQAYERRLKAMTEQSLRAEHLKLVGALTSGFCHEMATPINAIKMNLERLHNKEEYLVESVEIGLSSVEKLEKSLKNLNEMNKNKIPLANESIELCELVTSLSRELATSHINLKSSEKEIWLYGNRSILTKVLFDLLLNGIEASSENGAVDVFLAKNEGIVEFKFMNGGKLFPDFVLQHFGEPFVTAKVNGNGLGLYNAYNYAFGVGGSLQISNHEGKAIVAMKLRDEQKEIIEREKL